MEHRHLDAEALAAALPGEWADDARLALTALQDALTPETEETPCPVCAGVTAICDHGPVLLDRLAELATGLARTIREFTPENAPDNAGETGTPASRDCVRGTAPTHRPPPPTTVPINVSD
ncbi:hypothetical protein LWF15_22765 [Kineosporia rhizophila]|uniref:hypothetical protein n=1 Tax=Kineosporia TaxID=49184 RepID=UPI001E2960FC|nr:MULTISPECIES: hypothetical protein [Kineosporia]MCE0538326.1 hypothetical protein [Kineosporia rhizophila]GLY18618.1 hypothetical protein Kisp01_56320 [Kineosporia sp. NBRC 101677]